MSGKKRKSRVGITVKLIISFLSFSALTLLLLWVFQISLLDTFYKNITQNRVKKHADVIASNIDNDKFFELASRIVEDGGVSIKVLYFNGGTSLESFMSIDSMSADSKLLHSLSDAELYRLYNNALDNGGSCTVTYDRSKFNHSAYNFHDYLGAVPKNGSRVSQTIIYVRTVNTENICAVIYLGASLYPVDSTVDTLKVQLIYVTAIMILLSLVLSFVISRVISKPIIRLNKRAKGLATMDYSASFPDGGFREICELSDSLNHAALELGKVDRLKNELIANISHDLRTPLTLISGYAEMMRDIPGEMSNENLQVIIDETQRLSTLVSDVLDLSKIQSGNQILSYETFSLTNAIRDIIVRYSKFIEQSGFNIVFEPNEDVTVNADTLKISQVIYNLVSNAVHYTGEDKTVIIRQLVQDSSVRIEVSDSGDGIPEESLDLIWDRYYKVDKEHRRSQIGSGLGLSIVKGILLQHGAKFGVESQLGHGSTFWFALPLIEDI